MESVEAAPEPRRLHVKIEPPVFFAIFLLVAILVNRYAPFSLGLESVTARLLLGLPLFALAFLLATWAFVVFRRNRTSPIFGREVRQLNVEGPYRVTRNPLYLALALILAGFAAILDIGWIAIGVVLLLVVLDRFVVVREERFLRETFGEEYAEYTRRVRRWL